MRARNEWSALLPMDMVYRRASGRRRYNSRRKAQAFARRIKIVTLCLENDWIIVEHGVCTRLARILDVHRSTVSRDISRILAEANQRNEEIVQAIRKWL